MRAAVAPTAAARSLGDDPVAERAKAATAASVPSGAAARVLFRYTVPTGSRKISAESLEHFSRFRERHVLRDGDDMNRGGLHVAKECCDTLRLAMDEALAKCSRGRTRHLEVLEALPGRARVDDDRVPERAAVAPFF